MPLAVGIVNPVQVGRVGAVCRAVPLTGIERIFVFTPLRKAATGLAAAALALGGLTVAGLPTASAATVNLHIFTFNDFHGQLDGTPSTVDPFPNPVPFIYTIEKAVDDAGASNSMVISGGDNIGASEFASAIDKDNPTIQVLNDLAAEVNFVGGTVGNHEFDQGFADLANRINGSAGMTQPTWDYLAANVTDSTGHVPSPLVPYEVYTVAGVRIAVIGAVTQSVPSLVSPAGIAGLTFGDPVAAVNQYAAQIKANDEADIIIADYHDGAPVDTSLADAMAASATFAHIVNDTSDDVSAIINGHTHMTYNWVDAKGRPVVQAGFYGSGIADIELTWDDTTNTVTAASSTYIPKVASSSVVATDYNMSQVISDVNAALTNSAVLGQQVVGKVSDQITTAYTNGEWVDGTYDGVNTQLYEATDTAARDDRASESSLGTLVADSFLWTAQNSALIGGADIGIVNAGGGLRAELPSSTGSVVNFGDGTVSYAAANSVLPFSNNMWTINLTGAQIKQFLEEQWQTNPTTPPSRPFLVTAFSSNVTYTVNTDVTTDTPCSIASGCSWSNPASHITSVFVNGVPLDPAKTYKIITFSYVTAGGDNYWSMLGGTNAQDTGLLDRDAWIAYLSAMSGITDNAPEPTVAIDPSFARPSVVVSNLLPATAPMASTEVTAGDSITAALSRLDMTSLGSPANTTLSTYLVPLGSMATGTLLATTTVTAPGDSAGCAAIGVPATLNPASNGCAALNVTIPANTPAGKYVLVSKAMPSGTTIRMPITVRSGYQLDTGGSVASALPVLPMAAVLLIGVGGSMILVRRRVTVRSGRMA